jgi:hypothetical protein
MPFSAYNCSIGINTLQRQKNTMAIDKTSLTTKKDRQLNSQAIKRQKKMLEKASFLANKYYGTKDLKALTPKQLDKIVGWTTGHSPDRGRNQDRKAGKTKGRYIKGKL